VATHHFQRTESRTREFIVDRLRAYVLENEFESIPPVLRDLLGGCVGPKYGLQSRRASSAGAVDPWRYLLWGV